MGDKRGQIRGFAGLSELTSRGLWEDSSEGSVSSVERLESSGGSVDNVHPESGPVFTKESRALHDRTSKNLTPRKLSSSAWIGSWVIVGFIVLAFIALEQDARPPTGGSSAPSSSSRNLPAPSQSGPTSSTSGGWNAPGDIESPRPDTRVRSFYEKPSAGSDLFLEAPEIRWCVREEIKIEAMRPLVASADGLNVFNSLVDDFNRRCSNFQFYGDAMTQAESDVERFRSQIQAEARARAAAFYSDIDESSSSRQQGARQPSIPETTIPWTERDRVISYLESRYPEIDPASSRYSQSTVDTVVRRDNFHRSQNLGSVNALLMAANDVFGDLLYEREVGRATRNTVFSIKEKSTCVYKGVMTDQDYRNCGLRPPGSN